MDIGSGGRKVDDETKIRSLIGLHFEGMRWGSGTEPDWDSFRADLIPNAILLGGARPVVIRSLDGFIKRMETVARKNLHSFEEHTRGMTILRFGNIAVVLAASALLENVTEESVDISSYLLVKSDGRWQIAAHAWDQADEAKPIPAYLL
jgi:hypothetical protein